MLLQSQNQKLGPKKVTAESYNEEIAQLVMAKTGKVFCYV